MEGVIELLKDVPHFFHGLPHRQIMADGHCQSPVLLSCRGAVASEVQTPAAVADLSQGQVGRISDRGGIEFGRIIDFGLDHQDLSEVIERGKPFMTPGCLEPDGKVACKPSLWQLPA